MPRAFLPEHREGGSVQSCWTWSKEQQAPLHETAREKQMQAGLCFGTGVGTWAQPWLENQWSFLVCARSVVSALAAQHIHFSLRRGGCCWCLLCTSSTAPGKTSPQHGYVPWSHPWVLWLFHTARVSKEGECASAPSPASWAGASKGWKKFVWVTCLRETQSSLLPPAQHWLPDKSPTPGTHEALQCHPHTHPLLLLPAIAFRINRRNQMVPTWSQRMATSVLSIF